MIAAISAWAGLSLGSPSQTMPFELHMMIFFESTPSLMRCLAIEMPAAPAPLMATFMSPIFLPTILRALSRAAATTMAVPCWSSWKIGMSHSSISLLSISKQRGAEMSSRLMPPNEPERRYILIILTIASCGIRISELSSITVEAIGKKEVQVINKGKARIILLPGDLKKLLKNYCKDKKITSGPIFITRNGKPMDRSNIWKEMKTLAVKASVPSDLVFPHNFRHYFARNYYSNEKDIAGLSNLLGHSSLNTTMIYVKESVEEATRKVDRAGNRILQQ